MEPVVKDFLDAVQADPAVKRVVLGMATGINHKQGNRIRLKGEIANGYALTCFNARGVIDIFVYCTDQDKPAVKALIERITAI